MSSWYKLSEEIKYDKYKTKKIVDFFEKRTKEHIGRVVKYCDKIDDLNDDRFVGIVERGQSHDKSKYSKTELDPYIFLTWQYKCKADGIKYVLPEGMQEEIDKALFIMYKLIGIIQNITVIEKYNLLNKEDRDKPPDKIIDATKMKDLDIAEMCADFCSMSEEKGGDPQDWAKKNINVRWKFTKKQEDLIYEILDKIWEKGE